MPIYRWSPRPGIQESIVANIDSDTLSTKKLYLYAAFEDFMFLEYI